MAAAHSGPDQPDSTDPSAIGFSIDAKATGRPGVGVHVTSFTRTETLEGSRALGELKAPLVPPDYITFHLCYPYKIPPEREGEKNGKKKTPEFTESYAKVLAFQP